MADFFIDDTATGTDSGADWANAFISFTQLLASAFAAGDRAFVANTHTDGLVADTTFTFPGTIAAPNEIYSVDNTGSPEPPDNTDLLAGALIDCTVDLILNGSFKMWGMDIRSGVTSASNADQLNLAISNALIAKQSYEECKLSSLSTGSGAAIKLGTPSGSSFEGQDIQFVNVVLGLAHVSSSVEVFDADVSWRNKPGLGVAFDITSSRHVNPNLELFDLLDMTSKVDLDGLDLSNLSTLDGLFRVASAKGGQNCSVNNCKLNATFALVTGTRVARVNANVITLVNCDSGDTNYLFEQDSRQGNIVTDTAKTLNATNGTTAFSWKMVSSADADFIFPLYTPWIPVWVDATGAKTVTMEILHDGGVTNLNDDEFWIEVMYALNTGDPLYGLVDDRMVPLATPAAQADSVEGDWTEDLANENAQKAVTASITINEKGLIYARLALAKASQTIWLDPDPVVA